ncbi:hypothetical protein TYRP_012641 [Tyrophagus putrescentiae]|nr:hypothetical protein TYRP_012641 [Tyrophagus putrescentiae]
MHMPGKTKTLQAASEPRLRELGSDQIKSTDLTDRPTLAYTRICSLGLHLNGDGDVGRDNGEHQHGGVPEGGDHQATPALAANEGLRGELPPLGVQAVKGATS